MDEQEKLKLIILGIITHATLNPAHSSYIASWHIATTLQRCGYQDVSMATQWPRTVYDEALQALIDEGMIEELPELHYRYQLKRREEQNHEQ